MKRVLFVCTGNFYRSRLAEILFNHYAKAMGLDWEADSRGLAKKMVHRGISPSVKSYLEASPHGAPTEEPRNPIALSVDDILKFDLIVLLNKTEHHPELEKRSQTLVRSLQDAGKLRSWNVYDLAGEANFFLRLIGWQKSRPGQPPESAMEHIDFAVRLLVEDLAGQDVR